MSLITESLRYTTTADRWTAAGECYQVMVCPQRCLLVTLTSPRELPMPAVNLHAPARSTTRCSNTLPTTAAHDLLAVPPVHPLHHARVHPSTD